MKKVKLLLALVIALSFTGCSKESDVEQVMDAQQEYGCNVLNVFNWGEYIGENTISNFEKMYNVKVNYSLYDSNEAMYTKLLGGSAYDILIPSDYMIERLIDENLLQPSDHNIITNIGLLDENVQKLVNEYDPNNEYSIPYFWGTVGIVYNKNNVDINELETKGYNILLDEKYKGEVFLYDSERDSFMVALKALGYSMNTENLDEINEANQWLIDLHETMDPAYVTDEVNDAMINNEKDLAVVYSGAAAYIISENEDMAFYMPKEGTNIWSDSLAIPANASCPALANEFINFMIDYDSAMDSSITVGYTSSNKAVVEELSKTDFEGNEGYNFDSTNPNNEVFKHNETLKKILSDLWIKIKVR